jgi:hypothetical protein
MILAFGGSSFFAGVNMGGNFPNAYRYGGGGIGNGIGASAAASAGKAGSAGVIRVWEFS